jgi:glycerol-3-phosphate O-acyltransferase/dihydroxyacetone phosphate acyltransferase
MLYTVLRWCAQRALRWCYAEVTVVGAVPASGPVLLAVNHPNDLVDICVVLSQVPRRVLFVANVSAAEHPLVKLAYARMGVIPVHRVRDVRRAMARGENSAAANAAAMARVQQALRDGSCVVVFPEGGVHRGPHLAALRTGLAGMVLAAREAGVRGVQVVPMGLTYEAPHTLGTRVLVHVGAAIDVDVWTPVPERPAAPQLTAAVAAGLRAVTRNAPDERAHEALSAVADVVAATAPDGEPPLLVANAVWRALAGEIYGPGVQAEAADDARCAPAMALRAELGAGAVPAARVLAAWARRGERRGLARLVDAVLGPVGWVLHAPAWWAVEKLARRAGPVADRMARRIVPGLYVMVGWYALVGVCAAVTAYVATRGVAGAGGWRVAPVVLMVMMPAFGDAAARWVERRRDVALWRASEPRARTLMEHVRAARAAVMTDERASVRADCSG